MNKLWVSLILVLISKFSFSAPYIPLAEAPDEKSAALFAQLPDSEKELFITEKTKYLGSLEKVLSAAKYTYGIGFVTSDSIKFIKEKFAKPERLPEEIRTMMEDEGYREESAPKVPMRIRAAELNLQILSSLDKYMWANSPIVAKAKELGFAFSVGVQALGGIRDKGTGGVVDVGFSVTFNKEDGITAFQIFRNVEKFKSTLMPSGVAAGGVIWKVGPFWHNPNEKLTHVQGESFYPMGVPGISSTTERSLLLGGNSGFPGLFFPPSPVGDYLTYSTSLDHKVVFRIEFSRMYTGFLRIKADFGTKAVFMKMHNFIKEVSSGNKNKCENVFLGQY